MTKIEQLKIGLVKKLAVSGEEFTLTFAEKISQDKIYGEYNYTIRLYAKAIIADIFFDQYDFIDYLSVALNRGVTKKVYLGEIINIKFNR